MPSSKRTVYPGRLDGPGERQETDINALIFHPFSAVNEEGTPPMQLQLLSTKMILERLMFVPHPPSKTGEPNDLIDKRGFVLFCLTMPLVFIKDGPTSKQLKENPRLLERKCCSSVWLIARISKICRRIPETLEA